MNIIFPNNINRSTVSFSHLFSRKKKDTYILHYGQTSVLNGEARVPIPENSIVYFKNYKIDLTKKEMKSKIKKLKKNSSIVIGRNDINPDDTTISGHQFEFRKIGNVLYLYNLSRLGTSFTLLNPNQTLENYPEPANIIKKQPLTNYNPDYLTSRYGNLYPNFKDLFNKKYNDLRIAEYSDASTFTSSDLSAIQTAIMTKPRNGFVCSQHGWNYRYFEKYGMPKYALNRISLNVKANPNLIKELDELFATGKYRDIHGNSYQVAQNKIVPGCYKTYSDAKDWTTRHDPITMYFAEDMTPEFLSAVSDISEKYARPSCNGMPLVGEIKGKPWISVEKEPKEEDLKPMLEKAGKLYPGLKSAILSACYENYDYQRGYRNFCISAGEFEAIKIVLDEYEAYLQFKANNSVKV